LAKASQKLGQMLADERGCQQHRLSFRHDAFFRRLVDGLDDLVRKTGSMARYEPLSVRLMLSWKVFSMAGAREMMGSRLPEPR
jgi:hypothetical protein